MDYTKYRLTGKELAIRTAIVVLIIYLGYKFYKASKGGSPTVQQ